MSNGEFMIWVATNYWTVLAIAMIPIIIIYLIWAWNYTKDSREELKPSKSSKEKQ